MKLKEILDKAQEEITGEKMEAAVATVKLSLKNIASAKKTLGKLEKAHEELLDQDLEDLELDEYDY